MSWDLDARARFGPLDLHIRLATDAPVLLVVGPNGAGKTSLLRLIAGVRPLAAGHLRLAGRDLAPLPPEGRGIGYVPQNSGLFPHLTALGNVAYFYDRDVREAVERLQAMIEPLLMIILGAILLGITMSVLGPVYDIITRLPL